MREHGDLRTVLPQRHPILLLDRVLSLDPGRSIVALKAVTGSEPCYGGMTEDATAEDFGYPVSLMLESFGQACAVRWRSALPEGVPGGTDVLMFAAARDCRFPGRAYPGDVLRHEARLEQVVGDNAFASGKTWVGDRLVASMGSLLAVSRPAGVLRRPNGHLSDQPSTGGHA